MKMQLESMMATSLTFRELLAIAYTRGEFDWFNEFHGFIESLRSAQYIGCNSDISKGAGFMQKFAVSGSTKHVDSRSFMSLSGEDVVRFLRSRGLTFLHEICNQFYHGKGSAHGLKIKASCARLSDEVTFMRTKKAVERALGVDLSGWFDMSVIYQKKVLEGPIIASCKLSN